MLNTAVQNNGFPLAGLMLSKVVIQSAESLADCLSKPDIENLIKPNVHKCAVSGAKILITSLREQRKVLLRSLRETGRFMRGRNARAGVYATVRARVRVKLAQQCQITLFTVPY